MCQRETSLCDTNQTHDRWSGLAFLVILGCAKSTETGFLTQAQTLEHRSGGEVGSKTDINLWIVTLLIIYCHLKHFSSMLLLKKKKYDSKLPQTFEL